MNFNKLIKQFNHILILSGAGISTDSGIPDFRGTNGLYNSYFYDYRPKDILSRNFFNKKGSHKKIFWEYVINNLIPNKNCTPNIAHTFAYDLYTRNRLEGVITQNVDGLYFKTPLPKDKILEIHGNASEAYCLKCKKTISIFNSIKSKKGNRLCPVCYSSLEPGIVLYGDFYSDKAIKQAMIWRENADLLIVMGTTLSLLSDFVINFHGKICLINNEDILLESCSGNRLWDYKYIDNISDVLKNTV